MRKVPRIEVVCPTCKSSFKLRQREIERRKYCSMKCARLGNWSDPVYAEHMSAAHVGIPTVWEGRKHSRESIEKMRAAHFCGEYRVVRGNGYAYVYAPDHPRAIGGRIPEQDAMMEAHLGRPLRDDETVHHRNECKLDNRIENFEVLTISQHKSMHAKERGLGGIKPNTRRNVSTGRFIPRQPASGSGVG